jgi:hypothetical protein|tara:strand:- start:311 stop:562 length:252 start_codon:yes stop_codon:yes gene_type:complete
MDIQYGWPLFTLFLMFVSFWYGKVVGFGDGQDEGFTYGCEQGAQATAKVLIKYMRAEHDLVIDDATELAIINNINIEEIEYDD